MIVDSSVWIDWMRRHEGPASQLLEDSLRRHEVRMLPIILQEVLQGAATPERFRSWMAALGTIPLACTEDQAYTAVHAASLYAHCRWAGFTIRSSNDCLIAASCIELGEALLHLDADFERLALLAPELRRVAIPG